MMIFKLLFVSPLLMAASTSKPESEQAALKETSEPLPPLDLTVHLDYLMKGNNEAAALMSSDLISSLGQNGLQQLRDNLQDQIMMTQKEIGHRSPPFVRPTSEESDPENWKLMQLYDIMEQQSMVLNQVENFLLTKEKSD